ncbi:hypothetical protein VTK73DRAFT_2951 [Phialemonium thermophilum]|uniref:Uncharacterized protein n=1 Tax=Phialemonium thermophilum TaxID=223376 RepID=A0ABR3VM19_9PEZI
MSGHQSRSETRSPSPRATPTSMPESFLAPEREGSIMEEDERRSRSSSDRQEPSEERQQKHDEEQEEQPREKKRTRSTSPAYVAPIPKIGPIPPISPTSALNSDDPPSVPVLTTTRPQIPEFVGSFLVGKRIDEYGDIVDDKSGLVVGRAAGDLPSMVGRRVSNARGDVLGDAGELLGYVEDVEFQKLAERGGFGGAGAGAGGSPKSRFPSVRSLAEIMRQSTPPLMVDPVGNILDTNGNVVGKFHDNNNPLHRKEREEQEKLKKILQQQEKKEQEERDREEKEREAADEAESSSKAPEKGSMPSRTATPQPGARQEQGQGQGQERSGERLNAQSFRKENESPSDIFLDVKSTTEGIQLTIRIPTVFNGGRAQTPTVRFA